MQLICTHFTLHQCLYIRHEEQWQGKQSGSLLFSFHVSPSCHFNKQTLLPHLPDGTSSHKRTEDSLQTLLRGTRDSLALGKCQEEGLDMFCLPWESQIHRPPLLPPHLSCVNFLRAKLPARKSLPSKGSQTPWKDGCLPPSKHEAAHPETVWFPKAAAEGDK